MTYPYNQPPRYPAVARSSPAAAVGAVALLLLACAVFWLTESRTNWAKVAERVEVANPDRGGGLDGRAVSVTGAITSAEPLGDPDFLAPGQYIALRRDVEQYAWVEGSTRSNYVPDGASARDASGYYAEWRRDPPASDRFRLPAGHENPPLAVPAANFTVTRAAVSVWNLDLSRVSFEPDTVLPTAMLVRAGRGLGCVPVGDRLFCGSGTPDAPRVGDLRVRFTALRSGTVVTALGRADASTVAPLDVGSGPWMRVIVGDRAQALGALRAEFTNTGSLGHLVGFALSWVAMTLLVRTLASRLPVGSMLSRATRLGRALWALPPALLFAALGTLAARFAHLFV